MPFAFADGPCVLEDREGRPVWPVVSEEMLKRLKRSSAALSLQLCEVTDARPCAGGGGQGSVAAFGVEAEPYGRLHAWLTGRHFAGCVDHFSDVPAAVYVGFTEKISRRLLSEVYRDTAHGGLAPGLVHGPDAEELLEQVMHRALTTRHALDGDLAVVLPLQPRADTPGPAAIRKILKALPGVLAVHSHADGLDAFLHPALTLCAMASRLDRSSDARRPFCVETGWCYRQMTELGSATWRARVFDPADLSGQVVLLTICSSLLDPAGPIDPVWGLMSAALRAPRTGAIVATWTITHTAPGDFDGFVADLIRGAPLGEAVARHNAGVAPGSGGYLCLFGDPAIRLVPRQTLKQDSPPPVALSPADLSGVAFLRPLLELAVLNHPKPSTQVALEAARLYDLAARMGWPLEFENGPGETLRAAVMDYLTERGVLIFVDWSQFSDREGPVARITCPHCGARADASTRRIRGAEAELRCLVICDNCGIIEDRPAGFSIDFRVRSEGQLELFGVPEAKAVTLAVRMGCQDDSRSVALPWPRDTTGRPLRAFIPNEGWAPGAMRLTLMVMVDARLALYTVPTRAPVRPTSVN